MITPRGATARSRRWAQLTNPARLGLVVAAVSAVALLVSACSSSSSEGVAQVDSSATTSASGADAQSSGSADTTAFNACMRRRGVPLTAKGTPRFEAAKTACATLLPRSPDDVPDPQLQAQQLQMLLRYAACMRRNGLPSFPDPNPNPDGYVKISPDDLTARGLSPSSPKFEAAAAACKDLLPQGRGPNR